MNECEANEVTDFESLEIVISCIFAIVIVKFCFVLYTCILIRNNFIEIYSKGVYVFINLLKYILVNIEWDINEISRIRIFISLTRFNLHANIK